MNFLLFTDLSGDLAEVENSKNFKLVDYEIESEREDSECSFDQDLKEAEYSQNCLGSNLSETALADSKNPESDQRTGKSQSSEALEESKQVNC